MHGETPWDRNATRDRLLRNAILTRIDSADPAWQDATRPTWPAEQLEKAQRALHDLTSDLSALHRNHREAA